MDRREMLNEGLRSLAKTLPAMLSLTAGVGALLKSKAAFPPPTNAACFPAPPKELEQNTTTESDSRITEE